MGSRVEPPALRGRKSVHDLTRSLTRCLPGGRRRGKGAGAALGWALPARRSCSTPRASAPLLRSVTLAPPRLSFGATSLPVFPVQAAKRSPHPAGGQPGRPGRLRAVSRGCSLPAGRKPSSVRRGRAEMRKGGVGAGSIVPQSAMIRLAGCQSSGADAPCNAGRFAALSGLVFLVVCFCFCFLVLVWIFFFFPPRPLYLSIAKQLKVCMNLRASIPAGPSDARCIAL